MKVRPVEVQTARCSQCQIFTPTADILYAADGGAHCLVCGPPPFATDDDLPDTSATPRDGLRARLPRATPTLIAAAAMGLTVIGFFFAALLSQ